MRFTDDYLQTRYVNIKSDKVFNDFKMMVIGDIHMSFMVSLSKIKTIVNVNTKMHKNGNLSMYKNGNEKCTY